MKTAPLLSLLLAASALAQAPGDIGAYSMSWWFHTNAAVNLNLTNGLAGQALGYPANGVLGPITIAGGGGAGQDVKAVAGFNTDAEWQASSGYGKAIVGVDPAHYAFYSTLTNVNIPTGGAVITHVLAPASEYPSAVYHDPAENYISLSVSLTSGLKVGCLPTPPVRTIPGTVYQVTGEVFKISAAAAAVAPSPNWQNVTWGMDTNITAQYPTRTPYSVTFTATGENDFEFWTYVPLVDPAPFSAGAGIQNYTYSTVGVVKAGELAMTVGHGYADTYYSMSDGQWQEAGNRWTVEELLNNDTLSNGVKGQAIGYTGPGRIGKIEVGTAPRVASATIIDPELVAAVSNRIPILSVENTWGDTFEMVRAYLKTDANSTYPVSFWLYGSPTAVPPSLPFLELSTTGNSEANVASTFALNPGGIIMVELPATDVKWIQIMLVYTSKN